MKKYNKNKKPSGPRKNDQIRVPKIRVINDVTGDQLGIMDTKDALKIAKESGYDLVEIAPNAKPPVCKIMDYGKYLYQQSKREKKNKQSKQKTKEIKLSYNIGENDMKIKSNKAKDFLTDGCLVKLSLRLSGREMTYSKLAIEIMDKFIEDLQDLCVVTKRPQMGGNTVSAMLAAKKK